MTRSEPPFITTSLFERFASSNREFVFATGHLRLSMPVHPGLASPLTGRNQRTRISTSTGANEHACPHIIRADLAGVSCARGIHRGANGNDLRQTHHRRPRDSEPTTTTRTGPSTPTFPAPSSPVPSRGEGSILTVQKSGLAGPGTVSDPLLVTITSLTHLDTVNGLPAAHDYQAGAIYLSDENTSMPDGKDEGLGVRAFSVEASGLRDHQLERTCGDRRQQGRLGRHRTRGLHRR